MHRVVVVVLDKFGDGLRDSRSWGLGTRGYGGHRSRGDDRGNEVCSEVGQEVEGAVYGEGEKSIEDWL